MSFHADKKREHEQLAEKSLKANDFARAFFHTAKAAGFGLNLAEQSDGRLAAAYLKDANELLELAACMKEKARQTDANAAKRVIQDNEGTSQADAEKASQWMIQDKPDIKLDDVAGLNEVKRALREDVINPYSHPEAYERFKVSGGGGVLMYGPPGNALC